MKVNEKPVVVEETFEASIDTVWKAITDIDLMRQWYFDNIPDFKPEVGFETRFDVTNEGRTFPHLWKVTEVIPSKKIVYDWRFDGYPGDSFVAFELSGDDKATKLRLSCHVREDFPDNIPEFKRENCLAGWQYFISQSLKQFLAKTGQNQ